MSHERAATVANFHIYPTEKKGRNYYLVRYKNGKSWKSKFAPASLKTKVEVEAWVPGWLATQAVERELRSVRGKQKLLELVKKYPELQASDDGQSVIIPEHMHQQLAAEGELKLESPTLENLAPWWLTYRAGDPNVKGWRSILETWVEGKRIASRVITELQPKECRDWIRSIPRAPFTVRNIVAAVRILVDDARKEGKLPFQTINPFRDKAVTSAINNGKTVEKKHGDENTIVLTDSQAAALTKVADTKKRARYLVGLTAGLRESELAGLKWIDADLTKKTISVERQLIRGKGMRTKPPKKKSYRTLPLHPEAVKALEAMTRENEWVFGRYDHASANTRDDLLAAGESDKFLGHDGVEIAVDFHSLRRTFASTLEALGVDPMRIGACLGHKAKGVTAKHYLAKNLETVRADIARINFGAR